ncbi:hypothetical protein MUK42_09384 [Musa troglodytarum]|uniref:Uncharacterized protein n=1 Tax=Musa troglodytarum TaxID=320322 RepID=A0A9E7JD13_9LILI|nr:hypothetical protein MUK42_09384 [Musa troglodytarum]
MKFRLHSHDVPYGSGSGLQLLTGFPNVDDSNSYWPGLSLLLCARVCAAGIDQNSSGEDAVAQDVQDKEEAGEEDAPEPPHSPLDPHEDRQHHQVQRQAQALASHKTRVLRAQ